MTGWRSGALMAMVAISAAAPHPLDAQLLGVCEVTGYGIDNERQGAPTNMQVSRNQPCWFNLRFGADGLILSTPPAHGRVEVQGTRITYLPTRNYVGEDQFTLQSRGSMSTAAGRRRPNMQFQVHVLVIRWSPTTP